MENIKINSRTFPILKFRVKLDLDKIPPEQEVIKATPNQLVVSTNIIIDENGMPWLEIDTNPKETGNTLT